METQVLALILFLACACVSLANPANERQEDLSHLVTLLGKLKDIERVRQGSSPGATPGRVNTVGHPSFVNFADADVNDDFVDEESLTKGFLGRPAGPANKRQGAWSYDYGLGGGRFGKRNYGDYGIGGGRFGRDVDHVDLSDTNDADLMS